MELQSSRIVLFSFATILFITFITSPISAATTAPTKASLKFISATCNTTTYSSLCYEKLSPFASSIKSSSLKLCYTSIIVTIATARKTSTLVSKLYKTNGVTKSELAVIKDCKENIQDTIDEFNLVRKAISSLSGPDKQFQMSNAKTWASAALTDEDTCLDGFTGRKVDPTVKIKIQKSIKTVSRLSSISLSLITHLNY